jgi:hypothetical protein
MYSITKNDIEEAIEECNSAMTVKGQIIGYAIAHGEKNIENRSRKIKNGWYALHIGGSKNIVSKHQIIYSLLPNIDEDKLPPLSSIIGCFKIEGYIKESDSPWFLGPYGNIITKYIHFDTPISNIPGHQSITYKLDVIDKKLLKRNGKRQERIRSKIVKRLRLKSRELFQE